MEKIILNSENAVIKTKLDLKNYDIKTESYQERIGSFINDYERFEIHPFFQRHYVWGKSQKSNLIDTILKGLTIPAIYTYLDIDTGKEVVIDGQQRLMTIKKFYDNEFSLVDLKNNYLNGFDYFSMPKELKFRFDNYKIPIIQILNVDNKEIILEIFEKYNTGGIRLNKQEIRNCVFNGRYNDMIVELSKYEPFNNLFKKSEADRMIKEEFVLGFMALYQDLIEYNGNMNKFLEKHMSKNLELDNLSDEMFKNKTKHLINTFKKSIDANIQVFGKQAFRNCITYNNSKQIMYKTLSKPVFNLQMLGFADFNLDLIICHKQEIKAKYEELIISDSNFKPHYKKMSKVALNYRINKWKEEIRKIID